MSFWDRFRKPAPDIEVVHGPRNTFGDLYHILLQAPWWLVLIAMAALFLATNVVFALSYLYGGGIANARPGSFADAFFFSVQTLGTIGYGTMYPSTALANGLVTVESIAAVAVTALSTGVVFAKFSMPTARIEFTRVATISKMDGEPALAIRVANQRGNFIVEAQIRVTLVRADVTKEGVPFYRMTDLQLVRDRSAAFARGWTILHRITESSPLRGATPEWMKKVEAELVVSIVGVDGTSSQTIHARKSYDGEKDVRFGMRHADMLSPLPGGRLKLDYSKMHDLVPAPLD
jgi:inward rectifier potassium channel